MTVLNESLQTMVLWSCHFQNFCLCLASWLAQCTGYALGSLRENLLSRGMAAGRCLAGFKPHFHPWESPYSLMACWCLLKLEDLGHLQLSVSHQVKLTPFSSCEREPVCDKSQTTQLSRNRPPLPGSRHGCWFFMQAKGLHNRSGTNERPW